MSYTPLFLSKYQKVKSDLAKRLSIQNPHLVPQIKKISLHTMYGKHLGDNGRRRFIKDVFSRIAGQAPCETRARKSVSQFKIRTGMSCGYKVTLRGNRMYDFFARLWIALPRMRSFDGFNLKSFDGRGNFSFGIPDHVSFMEVENMIDYRFGFDVCISMNISNSKHCVELLKSLQMPFAGEMK